MHRSHFMASLIEARLWCFRRHIPLAIALVLIHQDCKYVGEYRCKEQHTIVKICKLSLESAALSAYIFKSQLKISIVLLFDMHVCAICLLGLYKSLASVDHVFVKLIMRCEELAWKSTLSSAPTSSSSALSFSLLIAQSFSFLCGLQDVLFHQGVLPSTPYKYKYSKQKLLCCG